MFFLLGCRLFLFAPAYKKLTHSDFSSAQSWHLGRVSDNDMRLVGRTYANNMEWWNHLRDRCDSSAMKDSAVHHVRRYNASIQWAD